MRIVAMRAGALAVLLGLSCLSAHAQSTRPLPPNPLPARDQAREDILDVCVETEAPKVGMDVDVTGKCQCYARGLAEAMSPADIDAVVSTRKLPPQLRGEAASIYARCSAGAQ